MWTRAAVRGTTNRHVRLKALGKSLLFEKEPLSGSEESAVVHFTQSSRLRFGDKTRMSDNDSAVVRTVETLTVVGVMDQHQYRRKKPGLQEGFHPYER